MKVIDLHCDTISELYYRQEKGESVGLYNNDLHIDIAKMKQGDYMLQNFAMFIDWKLHASPYAACKKMIQCFYGELAKNQGDIAPVKCYEDIVNNEKNGKISALLTIEEGQVLEGNIEYLKEFYDLGVRLMTLTWNYKNTIGTPNLLAPEQESIYLDSNFKIPNTTDGLTPFGITLLGEMEAIGMIIDVSHLSDAGFYQVLEHTKKPFIASHSSARAICGHVRNLSDDMIQKLANRGGIIGVNFCPYFIIEAEKKTDAFATLEQIVKHIQHIYQVGGIQCIALGSDFDGIPSQLELKNASFMPLLADALKKDGFTENQIESIFHKNALSFYKTLL